MLGLEIRVKVSDYVRDRIQSLRVSEPGSYQNIACIRSNAMKYLPNFFSKGQVSLHECEMGVFLATWLDAGMFNSLVNEESLPPGRWSWEDALSPPHNTSSPPAPSCKQWPSSDALFSVYEYSFN